MSKKTQLPMSYILVTLLLAQLFRFSLADVGTAATYSPPYTPTACYGNDASQFPSSNLFAAAGEGIWDNGAACGRQYKVRCISATVPRTCIPNKTIQIRIVDRAQTSTSKPTRAGTTMVLTTTAYGTIANGSPASINIEFQELAMSKRGADNEAHSYELVDGPEALGSYLRIQPCSGSDPELLECSIQWYRYTAEGGKRELISGATKSVYAPEPFDVGRILQAEIISEGQKFTLTTTGPIDPAAGLGNYVESLVRRHDTEFNVVIAQMNGEDYPSQSIHVLQIGKMRMKLCKGKATVAKEYYSITMQLCGIRGGGNAAAQALFWQAKAGLSFVLAFESARERNAAIMLARRFAFDCNIMLAGPDDRAPLGS